MLKAHQNFLESYSSLIHKYSICIFYGIHRKCTVLTGRNTWSNWSQDRTQNSRRAKQRRWKTTTLLGKNLHAIDGAIYGHNTSVIESLEHLKKFADERFTRKLEEVKHG